MRILIAEDEISIAKALKVVLEKNKYTVDMVHDGLEAFEYINAKKYDTIVLDIMMPKMDGMMVLEKTRRKGDTTPVLFLTAKSEVADRVEGLEAGADDYLPKPFAISEFLARVKALTRRSNNYTPTIVSCGNTRLDMNCYTLSAETKVNLNNKEYQLMELFFSNPNHVFSTEHLMEKVWELDTETNIDVVWTYIGFLRKKLRQIGADIEIKTIRGAGYALEMMKCSNRCDRKL